MERSTRATKRRGAVTPPHTHTVFPYPIKLSNCLTRLNARMSWCLEAIVAHNSAWIPLDKLYTRLVTRSRCTVCIRSSGTGAPEQSRIGWLVKKRSHILSAIRLHRLTYERICLKSAGSLCSNGRIFYLTLLS